jgi:hypothetical protein
LGAVGVVVAVVVAVGVGVVVAVGVGVGVVVVVAVGVGVGVVVAVGVAVGIGLGDIAVSEQEKKAREIAQAFRLILATKPHVDEKWEALVIMITEALDEKEGK